MVPEAIHSMPHAKPSAEYRAWLGDQEAYVFKLKGFAGGTISWISFDFHEPVTLRVRPHRQVDAVRVLPRRAAVSAGMQQNEATVRIERPGYYLVEWDGGLELPFLIFARVAPKESARNGKGRTLLFAPGIHRPGPIELHSGDHLHLSAGAEVYGAIHAEGAKDIRITGPGILRYDPRLPGDPIWMRRLITLSDCQDVVIDGPVLLDGRNWNVVLSNCDRVHVTGMVILAEWCYSTDGINPCDSRHVLIENCLIRSKDDCVSVKGLQRKVPPRQMKPIHDIAVRDCLFWSDNNNGVIVGTETWASEIRDIAFRRTDFVRVSGTCGDWAGAFSVHALADFPVHDILFEDIDVEYCSGNPFSILFHNEIYEIPGQRRPGGATIRDVTFRDIRFHQAPKRHSLVQGLDAEHRVCGVRFENIRFDGKPVRNASDLRLDSSGHVEKLSIVAGL